MDYNPHGIEDQAITTALAKAGFIQPSSVIHPRLFVCSTAIPKRGKSHWAVHAPDPVAVIAFDNGTELVAKKARAKGRRIWLANFRLKKQEEYKNETDAKRAWKEDWKRFETAIEQIVADKRFRTLVVDTGDAAWELRMLEYFGTNQPKMAKNERYSEWGECNSGFRRIIMDAYDKRDDLNMIWIHKTKKEYGQNTKGEDSWTGKYERAGFKDMSFLADVNIEHYFDTESREFGIRILDSRENMTEVIGMELTGELCTFGELALQVFRQHPEGGKEAFWK